MYDEELTAEIDRIIKDDLYLYNYNVVERKRSVFKGVNRESAKNRLIAAQNETRKESKKLTLAMRRGTPAFGGKRTRRLTHRPKTRKNNKKRSLNPVLLLSAKP
jgi:hypothetical protein